MLNDKACPSCGKQIPSLSPGGLCPQCLLKAGVAEHSSDPRLNPTQPSPGASYTGFVPPAPSQLAARFPQLEILGLLGKGGMGAVYKARQKGLDRLVALKILPPEISRDSAFVERFMREARALARLNHPNIIGVYDFGQTDGLCYFIMEYIDGVNLRQAIQAGDMQAKEALAVVPQICDALQFAHDEGIVHRDIKPENILLDKRGRVKIADFGLAKLLDSNQPDHHLTGTQQVMGTLRYMAPEQMEGSRSVDHRADIYSLGVVFYELLTGELPVGRFAAPSKKVHVDVRLDEVVLRALEKEPELRYQHASEVKTQVEAICGISPQVTRQLDRRWLVPILATLNIVFALALLLVTTMEDPSQFPEGTAPLWYIWGVTDNVLSFFMGAAVFLASIGLYLWQPWARKVIVATCVFGVVQLVVDMPYLTRFVIPVAYADLKQAMAADFPDPTELDAVASTFTAMLIGGALLFYLVWLIVTLVYFTRPKVVAAFEAEVSTAPSTAGHPAGRQPGQPAERQLRRMLEKAWVRNLVAAACALVYLACLIMFFSFHGQSLKVEDGRSTSFQVGQPQPWLTMTSEPKSFNSRINLLAPSVLFAGLGVAMLAVARYVEKLEKGKAHSMMWHYVIWGSMFAMVYTLGALNMSMR